MNRGWPGIVGFASAILTGCASPDDISSTPRDAWVLVAQAPQDPPDLLLIVLPGLRGDPENLDLLDGLGRRPDFRFLNAYAQSSSPFTGLGSLLTGQYPSAIPICGLGARIAGERTHEPWCAHLPADRPTLPALLKQAGYRTALFASGFSDAFLLGSDFQHVETFTPDASQPLTPWLQLETALVEWWSHVPSQRRHRSGGPSASTPRLAVLVLGDLSVEHRTDLVERMVGFDDPEMRTMADPHDETIALYHEEVGKVVERLNLLVDSLGELPQRRDRWTFLVGLHGVSLGERGGSHPMPDDHAFSDILLERTVHVPVAAWGPLERQGVEVVEPVQLVDVLPTLAWLAQAPAPPDLPGRLLLDPSLPGRPGAFAFSELGDMFTLRKGDHMLSFRAFTHNSCALDPLLTRLLVDARIADPPFGLFNVTEDFLQEHSMLGADLERAGAMRDDLVRLRTGPAAPAGAAREEARILALRLQSAEGYW